MGSPNSDSIPEARKKKGETRNSATQTEICLIKQIKTQSKSKTKLENFFFTNLELLVMDKTDQLNRLGEEHKQGNTKDS